MARLALADQYRNSVARLWALQKLAFEEWFPVNSNLMQELGCPQSWEPTAKAL
jgi:hypothetical protein